MLDEEILDMYQRNQEMIEELWKDYDYDDDYEVDRLELNHGDLWYFPVRF